MSDAKANYLTYLCGLLIEDAREAHKAIQNNEKSSDFDQGILHGYYCVLSLMEQQADTFGISREDIGLKGFNSDELLKRKAEPDGSANSPSTRD